MHFGAGHVGFEAVVVGLAKKDARVDGATCDRLAGEPIEDAVGVGDAAAVLAGSPVARPVVEIGARASGHIAGLSRLPPRTTVGRVLTPALRFGRGLGARLAVPRSETGYGSMLGSHFGRLSPSTLIWRRATVSSSLAQRVLRTTTVAAGDAVTDRYGDHHLADLFSALAGAALLRS
jgi:hypothetical protein